MTEKEKGCRQGSPIPKVVLADKSEGSQNPLNLQVALLTRRCAISAAMAAAVAPLAFGEAPNA